MILTYSTVRYGEIDVCWTPELEGGGMSFGQDYLPVVANLFGHVGRVFEFCAGPGFIGFSLLAHGLCDSLALIDVNPAAVAAARETVRRNGLEDRVTVYLSDGLDGLPADERCDESGTKWGRQRSPGRAMFAVVGSWLASASPVRGERSRPPTLTPAQRRQRFASPKKFRSPRHARRQTT